MTIAKRVYGTSFMHMSSCDPSFHSSRASSSQDPEQHIALTAQVRASSVAHSSTCPRILQVVTITTWYHDSCSFPRRNATRAQKRPGCFTTSSRLTWQELAFGHARHLPGRLENVGWHIFSPPCRRQYSILTAKGQYFPRSTHLVDLISKTSHFLITPGPYYRPS
jgi:hypothetical protein